MLAWQRLGDQAKETLLYLVWRKMMEMLAYIGSTSPIREEKDCVSCFNVKLKQIILRVCLGAERSRTLTRGYFRFKKKEIFPLLMAKRVSNRIAAPFGKISLVELSLHCRLDQQIGMREK